MIRAFVERDFALMGGVKVTVIRSFSNAEAVEILQPDGTWRLVQPNEVYDGPPSYRFPGFRADVGRAVLDGLLEHYQGPTGDRKLREDYDAERKRVDKLMDAIIAAGAR